MRKAWVVTAVAVFAVAVSTLAGCGTKPGADRPDSVTIVASTDVWGSVAEAVAGDDARVSSIITSATADPHSFEASPSDAAAIADASVVVYNGGGYDSWVDEALKQHPGVGSVNAYSLLDAAAVGEPEPANEHVFYELGTAKAVANALADKLAAADPERGGEYRSRAAEFGRKADTVRAAEQTLASEFPETNVVSTEPVAHYLLRAAGLTDRTPAGFTASVEQDTDPAAADVAAILDLVSGRDVAAVLFNEQTATEATRRIRRAAQEAGVPVVTVTETLPPDTDYLTWQRDTVERLAAALRKGG